MQKFKFSLFGLLILMFAGAGTATAQVLFFEDFQGGMPANFTLVNGDNNTPATNVAYVNDAWIVREDFIYDAADSVAFSTSWYTPAGAADDWMITPAITLGNNTVLSWDAVAPDGTYADGYEVEIASSPLDFAAGNGINIFTMPAEGQAWTTHTVNLSAYAGQTVYVAFHNNSFDDFLLMIDDIMLEEPTSAFDAAVNAATNMHPEYTIFPISQAHPFTLEAEVMNTGANAVTNVQLEVNVLDGNLNVLNTAMSSAIASLAPTTTAMLSVPSYTPMDTGLYFAEYIVSINEADGNGTNDTLYNAFFVSDSVYARDDAQATGSIGIGAGAAENGIIGQNFDILNPDQINSVTFLLNFPNPSDVITASVYNTSGGIPNTEIAETIPYTITTADTNGVVLTLPIVGGPINVAPGEYFVGVNEDDSLVSLATTPNIFTLGKGWIYWDALGSWSNPEDFGAQFEDCYIIRPNLVGTSTPVTDVAISNGTHGPNAQMPLDQAVPVMLQADVANVGTVDATDVSVTFNVYTEVSGFALDWTASSAPMMLPVGGSQTVMAPMTYMPMDTGTIIYEYIVSTTGPDGNADNDTTASLIYINETTFARDLAIFGADIGGLGFGSPAIDTAEIGTWYTVNTAADVNSVTGWTFFHGAGEIGATLSAEIYNYTPGVGPGSLVASSNTMMVTDSTVVEYVFTFPGTVNLTPGDYFFAIKGTNFLGQTDEYNAPEVTWGRVGPISGWGDLTGAFPGPMMVWPSMTAVACPTITANTSFSNASGPGMMDGSATVTAGGGQAPYTYLWSNGGTTATIMGLAAGTYTVTVTDANGCTGMGSATVGEDAGSCTPCPQPTNVTRSATSSTITLNWDAEPCAMNSQVQHRIKPLEVINNGGITDQGNGIVGPGITTRTLNYNSANCGLFYQARVRHLCGAGGTNPGPWKLLPVVPTSCSKNGELSVAVELFPNPAEDNVNLTVALTEAVDVNITVYDILGASVYEAEMNGEEGANFFNIDISEMSSGVYTVVLDSNGASNTLKFVKQ